MTTLLVDTATALSIIQVTATRKRDPRITSRVVKQNTATILS